MHEPDLKYHGDDEISDLKLNNIKLCEKPRVLKLLYSKAYPKMLRGQALTQCYFIIASPLNKKFENLCEATKKRVIVKVTEEKQSGSGV